MTEHITSLDVSGNPGPITAAAIAAVIAEVLHGEAVQRSTPARRPRPGPWVGVSMPRPIPAPMPSESFESVRWVDRAGDVEDPAVE